LAAFFLAAAACAFHFFSRAFTPFLNCARSARVWALLGVAANRMVVRPFVVDWVTLIIMASGSFWCPLRCARP
jgi:hypothetical protein